MASTCSVCKKDVEAGLSISCNKCNIDFHWRCVKLTASAFKEMSKNDSMAWFCSKCKGDNSSHNSSTHCCSEDKIINAIKELFADKIDSINKKCELTDNNLNSHISSTADNMKSVNEKIINSDKNLIDLKVTVQSNTNVLNNIGDSLHNLQRNIRLSNLLLSSLPDIPQTVNLKNIIVQIAVFLKCPIDLKDLDSCFRIKSRNGKVQDVLIKFRNKCVRDDLLSAYLTYGSLKLSDVCPELNINSRLYINEHLTSYNNYLMRAATKLRHQNVIFKCYSRNGNVYIRKHQNDPVQYLTQAIIDELQSSVSNKSNS